MRKVTLLVIILILCGAMFVAGCVTPTPPPQTPTPTPSPTLTPSPTATTAAYNVKIYLGSSHGNMLTDGNGMTLYYSTKDVPGNGTSWCYATCAANWPPFSVSPVSVQPPLNPADFGQITRTDGIRQVTYTGYPLYYFHTDTKPGDTNGYGILESWYVIGPGGIITTTATATPATTVPTTRPTTERTTTSSSY
jgi:predicted lipoprotein with Yx(FWY)xxD motif